MTQDQTTDMKAPQGCRVCEAVPGVVHVSGCPNAGVNDPALALSDADGWESTA